MKAPAAPSASSFWLIHLKENFVLGGNTLPSGRDTLPPEDLLPSAVKLCQQCEANKKKHKSPPSTRSQQLQNNMGTTLASLAFGEEEASSPPQFHLYHFPPLLKAKRQNLTLTLFSYLTPVPLRASKGRKKNTFLPDTRMYHAGVTFATGNGHTQNAPFTEQYNSKAPCVPDGAYPSLECLKDGG